MENNINLAISASLVVSAASDGAARRLHLKAPAKLNLVLRIGAKRADGFHGLNSLVVLTDFCDEIVLTGRTDGKITLGCNRDDLCDVQDNLVYRAAELVAACCKAGGDISGVDIELVKNIPAGAGLGGGSADAAVTLAGLNWLWDCGLDTPALMELAARLGSDVPLTLGGSACVMSGRGEIINPITLPRFGAILLCPPVHCATGAVYGSFDSSNPAASDQPAEIDIAAFKNAPPSELADMLVNDLALPAMTVKPELVQWKDRLESATDKPAFITGSGSAMFCVFDNFDEAKAAHKKMPQELAGISRPVLTA